MAGKKVGERYFALAEAEMRAGKWQESMENFAKAKGNMESCGNTEQVKYPLTLMKLSQLKLNACEFEACLACAKLGVESFEKL